MLPCHCFMSIQLIYLSAMGYEHNLPIEYESFFDRNNGNETALVYLFTASCYSLAITIA